ncbi:hypothetical protein AMATHDRAFT_142045 [Amanita thiersii Skay4041]|uniref:t-SNARE coiled-coil homology domain-containing protein n=1 Tax=Amanita thiersii Skay4041 TaxID=703135 RepID=A0A2A9NNG1_9AGAR|nr:hypothetical protein AMATHDRAFT_142045 [Amanita thiersii Skay4041]
MSLPKLTSVSTHTLSLLLERQRLHSLPSFASSDPVNPSASAHLPQITKNLTQLRVGILELEANEGRTEAVSLLRNQYERMRSMLAGEGNVERFASPSLLMSTKDFASSAVYTPYTDDPDEDPDPDVMLQTQRQMMLEQDDHLDRLSQSIGRQHHISLQINDELDTHTGLLDDLDTDLDRTGSRLTSARRRLDRFAKGAKENGSTVTIALLILVLLILIIIFKT